MARNIIIVNATQVVTSESNPQGVLSVVSGYPKIFDSVNYKGDIEAAMRAAKADYYNRLSANYANINPNRIMTTVTLEEANGHQILRGFVGELPDEEAENGGDAS